MTNLVKLSKYLALVLRHRAADFGLSLDANGFVDLEPVWALVERRFPGEFTCADLTKITAGDSDGKKRYEIVDGRIRAMYGHTRVEVTYPPAEPPEILYHGTSHHALVSIHRFGLKPMKRQYVHMSDNMQRAEKTGGRHDDIPVLLRVHALDAHHAGIIFHHPEAEHWLAKSIPSEFIEFPE